MILLVDRYYTNIRGIIDYSNTNNINYKEIEIKSATSIIKYCESNGIFLVLINSMQIDEDSEMQINGVKFYDCCTDNGTYIIRHNLADSIIDLIR